MSDTQNKKSVETTMSPKQLVGAGLGIVALLVILFLARTFSKPLEAEIMTEPAPPMESYTAEAITFDPFAAAGKEYDPGQLVIIETDLDETLQEPVIGDVNVVLEMSNEVVGSESDKTVPVVLVFIDRAPAAEALQDPGRYVVMGRYIGTVEIESAIGTDAIAQAVQVDHLDAL